MIDELDVDTNIELPGVYFLLNDDELLYIGQTDNLRRRLYQHKRGNWFCYPKLFNKIWFIEKHDAHLRRCLEKKMLGKFQPKFNYLVTELPDIPISVLADDFGKVAW